MAPAPFHELVDPADTAPPQRAESPEAEAAVSPLVAALLSVPPLVAAADPAEIAALRATYAGMIAEVDHQFGRLVDYLRDTGQLENTLIVMFSARTFGGGASCMAEASVGLLASISYSNLGAAGGVGGFAGTLGSTSSPP